MLLLFSVSVVVFSGYYFFRLMTPEKELAFADELFFLVGDIPPFNYLLEGIASAAGTPLIQVRYDVDSGRGYVIEQRDTGERFMVNFSLFSGDGLEPKGLFVGGAPKGMTENSSGVSYYDGNKWRHLWCTANEGIAPSGGKEVLTVPSWKYISGRIIRTAFGGVTLISEHEVLISGQPLRITRTAAINSGENYFTLAVTMTNIGTSAVSFDYAYGDEPWVGEFGSSSGDIGWHSGGLVKYETRLPLDASYAGFIDYGNDLIGEPHVFDNTAGFIEWHPPATEAYFSNDFHRVEPTIPLSDRENRVLNIVWKNQSLEPGQSRTYRFAIGMARFNEISGLPEKPLTGLKN